MDTIRSEHSIDRLTFLVQRLESLCQSLELQQEKINRSFENLKSESDQALQEARLYLSLVLNIGEESHIPTFKIPISDVKLQRAWKELFRYPEGATADSIAAGLDRHRSTVSTYLNMLVATGYAEKFRKGHEIYYKALIKSEK